MSVSQNYLSGILCLREIFSQKSRIIKIFYSFILVFGVTGPQALFSMTRPPALPQSSTTEQNSLTILTGLLHQANHQAQNLVHALVTLSHTQPVPHPTPPSGPISSHAPTEQEIQAQKEYNTRALTFHWGSPHGPTGFARSFYYDQEETHAGQSIETLDRANATENKFRFDFMPDIPSSISRTLQQAIIEKRVCQLPCLYQGYPKLEDHPHYGLGSAALCGWYAVYFGKVFKEQGPTGARLIQELNNRAELERLLPPDPPSMIDASTVQEIITHNHLQENIVINNPETPERDLFIDAFNKHERASFTIITNIEGSHWIALHVYRRTEDHKSAIIIVDSLGLDRRTDRTIQWLITQVTPSQPT